MSTIISGGGMYVDLPWTDGNIAVFTVLLSLLLFFAFTEVSNYHFPYSKFAKEEAIEQLPYNIIRKLFAIKMSSKFGFFLLYFIPLIGYLILFGIFSSQNMASLGAIAPSPGYTIALCVGWSLSFFKRCMECLFVHVYSGEIPIFSTFIIAVGYTSAGLACLYYSNQVVGYVLFGPQTIVKDIICFIFYFIGITVNFYSHLKLRWIRTWRESDEPKRYHSPAEIGILFQLFICPHYVFEILIFAAWATLGATSIHYMVGFTILLYLGLRTRATYKWYVNKGMIKGRQASEKSGLLQASSPV